MRGLFVGFEKCMDSFYSHGDRCDFLEIIRFTGTPQPMRRVTKPIRKIVEYILYSFPSLSFHIYRHLKRRKGFIKIVKFSLNIISTLV